MATHVIRKNFSDFRGQDLRKSDLTRDRAAAIEFLNVVIEDDQEALVTRPGSKIRTPSGPYLGLWTYSWTNPTTGETEEELVGLSDNLERLTEETFAVAYAGASSTVQVNIYFNTATSTYKFKIIEDVAGTLTTMLDYDLGTGLEASPVTLANLDTQITAISSGDYSATYSGTTTHPAAFLPVIQNEDLSGGTLNITYYEWEDINASVSTPFSAYYAARGSAGFEFASAKNLEESLYIAAGGYQYLLKYDGQNVYRAGLPEATAPSIALNATGSLTGDYFYVSRLRQTDNRGNIRTFWESDYSDTVTLAGDSMDVTLTNVLAGTGFLTNCAIVNGNQNGITTGVTVDNTPHTVKVGDTITLLDRSVSPAALVERVITAVAATSLTWAATTAIDVDDNDVISVGLVHELYRNKAGGTFMYLVGEFPNNSFTATQVINDDLADTSLVVELDVSLKNPELLDVKPRYIQEHQGLTVVGGAFNEPNIVRYSNADNIEGFDTVANVLNVPTTTLGGVSGLISDNERLIVGKETCLYSYAGDLDAGGIIPQRSGDAGVGIAAHNSIQETTWGTLFISQYGIKRVQYGQIQDIGEPVDAFFTRIHSSSSTTPRLKHAFSIVDEKNKTYLCYIPTETGTGTSQYANDNSRIRWLKWRPGANNDVLGEFSGMNCGGGIAVFGGDLVYQSRREDLGSGVAGNCFFPVGTGGDDDYVDHTEAIDFQVGLQWDDLDAPSILKLPLWLKVYNLAHFGFIPSFTLTIRAERDFTLGGTYSETSMSVGDASTSGWGYGEWALFSWGSPSSRIARTRLKRQRVRAFRFVLGNNTALEKVSLTGIEYEVAMAYQPVMKE